MDKPSFLEQLPVAMIQRVEKELLCKVAVVVAIPPICLLVAAICLSILAFSSFILFSHSALLFSQVSYLVILALNAAIILSSVSGSSLVSVTLFVISIFFCLPFHRFEEDEHRKAQRKTLHFPLFF